jgi:hypothetical protein
MTRSVRPLAPSARSKALKHGVFHLFEKWDAYAAHEIPPKVFDGRLEGFCGQVLITGLVAHSRHRPKSPIAQRADISVVYLLCVARGGKGSLYTCFAQQMQHRIGRAVGEIPNVPGCVSAN